MEKIQSDHTGEAYHNRLITGRGDLKVTVHIRKGRQVERREQKWKWRCRVCGGTGESLLSALVQYGHRCPPVKPKQEATPYLCAAQCRKCGHYRAIGTGMDRACLYILDARRRRPQVDLATEPCPVRDEKYRAKPDTGVASLPPALGRTNYI